MTARMKLKLTVEPKSKQLEKHEEEDKRQGIKEESLKMIIGKDRKKELHVSTKAR